MKKIASNVYVETSYRGVNVGFIALPMGVIAVDAPTLPQDARTWRQRILDTTGGPILYVVLTDAHPDRISNVALLEAPVVAARAAYEQAMAFSEGGSCDVEAPLTLPQILFTDSLTLHKGGVDVKVQRVSGSAPGSAWIYLPEQDVLFTGDTLVVRTHPFLAAAPDTKAWLETLKALRQPRFSATTIVPGRGPLCNQSATRPLSEYLALVRRRVRSLRAAGQSRADRAALVAELLPLFPVPESEREAVQRRIKAGLDRLYEELEDTEDD